MLGLTFEAGEEEAGFQLPPLLHISHSAHEIKFGSKGLDHSQHAAYFNALAAAHTFISREFPSIMATQMHKFQLRREFGNFAINYQRNANLGSLDRQQLGLFRIGA